MKSSTWLACWAFALPFAAVAADAGVQAQSELGAYCLASGGQVVRLTASFDTHAGPQQGVSRSFCRYQSGGWSGVTQELVGLDTLSTRPTIAATLIQSLRLDSCKSLPLRPYDNPALNVCTVLHGAEIADSVASGGFGDALGQSDVCVFGDGSSVSAWTLVYAALGYRTQVKSAIRSQPLPIDIPSLQGAPSESTAVPGRLTSALPAGLCSGHGS